MRGHLVKRGKNSYTIVVSTGLNPATGKYMQQWVTVKGTKKQAEQRLTELLHELDTETFVKPGKTTLKEFLERWLKDYVWPNLAPRTAEGYEHIVRRHLIPGLGNIQLIKLKPEHLQRYYSLKSTGGRCDGKGGLSSRSVRHHHVTLHNAMQSAVKWGILSRNPVEAVSTPRFQRPEWHILSEEDITFLLDASKKTQYYALFYMALFTGMRRSELLALRWSDVDLLLCQVFITRTLHHLRNGEFIFRPPKTIRGRRIVSLSPSTALVLREHLEKQEATKLMLGTPLRNDDLVFSDQDGRPILPDTVTHAWIKLVRSVGLSGIRLHDARHSHASLMLKAGIHPKIVQERLGHASIQITMDTYSHVTPGLQESAAARFDEMVSSERKNGAFEHRLLANY